MELNAGCGLKTEGDVRLDIELFSKLLYRRKTTANIAGDIQHLPFKDKVFKKTIAFAVLEHVENPKIAFKELKRVTNGTLIVQVPKFHLYCLILEVMYIVRAFFAIPLRKTTKYFLELLNQFMRAKSRYADHKWYIRFKHSSILRQYGIPATIEYRSDCE